MAQRIDKGAELAVQQGINGVEMGDRRWRRGGGGKASFRSGQNAPGRKKQKQGKQSEPEGRHTEPEEGGAPDHAVHHGPVSVGGDQRADHGGDEGQKKGVEAKLQACREAIGHLGGNRFSRAVGKAPVTAEKARHIAAVLHDDRLVQAHLLFHARQG